MSPFHFCNAFFFFSSRISNSDCILRRAGPSDHRCTTMFGSRASLSAPHRWDLPHAKDPLLTSFRLFVLSAASAMFTLHKRKKKKKTWIIAHPPQSPCNNVMISFTLKDQKDLPSCCQSHRAHALFYFFSPPPNSVLLLKM